MIQNYNYMTNYIQQEFVEEIISYLEETKKRKEQILTWHKILSIRDNLKIDIETYFINVISNWLITNDLHSKETNKLLNGINWDLTILKEHERWYFFNIDIDNMINEYTVVLDYDDKRFNIDFSIKPNIMCNHPTCISKVTNKLCMNCYECQSYFNNLFKENECNYAIKKDKNDYCLNIKSISIK